MADNISKKQIFHIAIQLLALGILIVWCFQILFPFITPVVWGIILTVTFYPYYQKLKNRIGGRRGPAAAICTILLLAFFIVPPTVLGFKTVREFKQLAAEYRAGKVSIPPPPQNVKDWPVIGGKTYELWSEAANGLDTLVQQNRPQARRIAGTTIGLLASAGKGILLFTLSIIVSGAFLYNSDNAGDFAKRLFDRLTDNPRLDVAMMSARTIRNVVKGILIVAVIQTTLAGAGFLLAGIPAAGLLTLICLVLAIIQVGILPISIITIIYIWGVGNTLTATLFTIWILLVGLSDNVLKPWLLGRDAPVPMLVVFLGALGGFLLSGFIGLFTGAVVLSLGYKLFTVWLKETDIPPIKPMD